MSTRSVIAKKLADGKIRYVYAHWDGYPSHNGKILLEAYDEAKLDKLLALGSVSVLGREIGEKHDFNLYTGDLPDEDPRKNYTKFYGRDRGEAGQEARDIEEKEIVKAADDCGAEYVYLFVDGQWQYARVPFPAPTKLEFCALTSDVVAKD